MSTPPGATEQGSSHTSCDEERDVAAEAERLAEERISELQAEINALRRENEELRLADTERRRDEEELRRENERVGAILSALDTGQSLVDPDMTIVWVNQKARDLFPGQEPVGQKCYRYFEGLNEPCEVCAARRVFATGEVTRVEKYVPEHGRWLNIVAQPVKDASGRVTHALESFTDITERKQAEEALRESEERFTAFMDNSPAGAWMKDDQGRLVYLNKILEKEYSARSEEDWRGKTDFELWPSHVAEQFQESDRTVLEEDRAIEVVEERPNPEGGFAYWWNFKFPFQDASGKKYVGGVGIDITASKRTEAALQESEGKYRNLVELAPDPIAVHRQGILVYVNPPCVALFGGERREDLIGKPILRFVHPDDQDVVGERIRRMGEEGTAAPRIVERFLNIDGQVVDVEVVATPVVYENLPSVMVLFRDITERKGAEDALRESEEKYRTLVETALDMVLIHDGDRILYINPTGATLLGASRPDEILGRNVLEIVHPDFRDGVRENYTTDLRGEPSPATRLQLLRLDGTTFWVEGKGVMTSIAGTPVVQVIIRDITERKRAEEALQESEERLQLALDAADAGMWEWDLATNRNVWSEKLWSLYGLEPHSCEPSYDAWRAPIHPDDLEKTERIAQEAAGKGLELNFEYRVLEESGRVRWLMSRGRPLLDTAGKPTRYIGIIIDITERKRAEEALQRSEEKYRTLFDTMSDAFSLSEILCNAAGEPYDYRFLEINLAWEKETGLSREQFLGKTASSVLPGLESYWIEIYGRVALTGETMHFENYNRDTGRWYDVLAFSPSPGRFATLFRNITDRKRTEKALVHRAEELTRLQSELEAANREANLYLDILTHDIGNTENVSNLYVELLIEFLDGEAAGYAKRLQRSIQKSIEILGTVSTIRRIHRTTTGLKPVDLDAVVRGAIEDYPCRTFLYDGAHHRVLADDLLPVVFDNLIGNAVKFGGPGVQIAVRIHDDGDRLVVSIEDTGPGVPDGEKQEIFHRYEKKKRGVGEGLGLYLVQILVERYGGRVWADDRIPGHPEEGAVFRFTLKKA